jgi:CheY-like chemotaxis protein
MPGKEGIETIMEIRNEDAKVPIVAISGGGQYLNELLDNILESAELLGATYSISKPFRRHEFLKVVAEATNKDSL